MKLFRVSFAAAAAAIAQLAAGQTAAPDSNPADPQAATAPVHYQSAFSRYRPYRDAELANWREINDQVRPATGEADGTSHAGHAGPGSSTVAAPAGPPAGHDPAAPAARGHRGLRAAHSDHGAHAGHGSRGTADARHHQRSPQP